MIKRIVISRLLQSGSDTPPFDFPGDNRMFYIQATIDKIIRHVCCFPVSDSLKLFSRQIMYYFHKKNFLIVQIYISVKICSQKKPQEIWHK